MPSSHQGVPAKIYTVRRGDTLYDIAKAHSVKVADLQRWNNLGGRSQIKVGQTLTIGAETATAANAPILHHTVKPGEYPGIIAQLYGVSVSDLLRWNNLDKRSVIRVGDKLIVAGDAAASPGATIQEASVQEKTAAPATIKHKVASGDTAGAIANRYGVKTKELLAWNNLTAKSILRVGQYLTVRNPTRGTGRRDQGNDVQMAQSQANNRVVHKVTAGQNPTTIARQYGVRVSDLFKWNNWKDKHILRIGDEVEIYHD
ncbi:MAG TPA: LysM peptidoglycan-binding domain-containing protein [Candidatus Hydrogenedentes bacterium]|nr:LysM peptidoglycan-binding domain-containing protein [Candidatus Hydrogenedentota bacterium]